MSSNDQRHMGILLLIPNGKGKFDPTGNQTLFSRATVQDTNHCSTRSSHRKCFQSYFIVRPTIIALNVSHRYVKCLGDVSLYTLYPILTLLRSTSLTSGLLCDHCLHNHVSRNASRTRSCFDLSLCLLNRTKRNRHNFYCTSIAETVHCRSHISNDFLTSLAGALLSHMTPKVGRSSPSLHTLGHYGSKTPVSVGQVYRVDLVFTMYPRGSFLIVRRGSRSHATVP